MTLPVSVRTKFWYVLKSRVVEPVALAVCVPAVALLVTVKLPTVIELVVVLPVVVTSSNVWPVMLAYASSQALPLYTFISPDVVLKYRAPVIKASPSLSNVGSDALAPR